jgi:hypothetical protein
MTSESWRTIRIVMAFTWLVAVACSASAQSGTNEMRNSIEKLPTFGASAGTEILRHRGPTGNTCLAIAGYARPHTVNPKLYDHVISVTNSCAQRIALQICYYRSQECISVEIPGGERKDAILGTLPSMKDFRFEFREKF